MGRCLSASEIKAWILNDDERTPLRPFPRWYARRQIREQASKKPAVSSILTVSAPVMLLSASLNSFLAGFGVYLGLSWTQNSNDSANADDNRNVFLIYIVGLGVCYGIYAISATISQGQRPNPWDDLPNLLRQANAAHHHQTPRAREAGEHIQMEPPTPDVRSLLAQALLEAATAREQSAQADRRVADMCRELSRQMQPDH